MSLQQMRNDVAVITDASSVVGRAIARAFAEQGARIALLATNVDGLQAAAKELRELGAQAMVLPLDVADSQSLDEAADRILAEWGQIDLWVNNAMVSVFAPGTQGSSGKYRRALQVDYLDHLQGTLAALRHMRPQNRGVILQVSSSLSYRSIPRQRAFCASKAAIRSFTDSLRSELDREGSGIAVTMLHLPAVSSPQPEVVRSRPKHVPEAVPPFYPPAVVAQAAVYAALHSKQELWLGSPQQRSTVPAQGIAVPRARSLVAPNRAVLRTRHRRTHPVMFAVLGLSAAALAFGPVRRWAREHARLLVRSR